MQKSGALDDPCRRDELAGMSLCMLRGMEHQTDHVAGNLFPPDESRLEQLLRTEPTKFSERAVDRIPKAAE